MLLACRAIPTKKKKDCAETKLWFLLKSPVIHCISACTKLTPQEKQTVLLQTRVLSLHILILDLASAWENRPK